MPLLLKLGENKKALLSATESGDTDLVYTVLLQLKEQGFMGDFHMIIRKFPMAQNLYKKYCQQYSKSALQEVYTQEDDFLSQAEFSLREGIEVRQNYRRSLVESVSLQIQFQNSSIVSVLPIVANNYKKCHKYLEADLCDETRKLLKQQQSMDDK